MEHIATSVLTGMDEARRAESRRPKSLRVVAGKQTYPVLRRWRGGFALDAAEVTQLRGLVDLYEGPRHVAQCLITASEIDGVELICTLKRETAVAQEAARDFAEGDDLAAEIDSDAPLMLRTI
ncbi:hypothetical protein [Phaeovulum vinaykumarii]|uniref:Uncharacterized protein n=1 Tax=Phaeovulum vinaykumarii TaxID=407234 RepID=A0A1N7L4C5_9RHOB|nr:hypothetical protein [Phaeovulum vinaykumarii]SIS68712.1 hypothetical protein SAMN05421795_102545 [Phaeovulum vinaykumarii]SOB99900.1 hypothetical protein SAMN05878426_102227 [Phaeovulum vinaykumarii]